MVKYFHCWFTKILSMFSNDFREHFIPEFFLISLFNCWWRQREERELSLVTQKLVSWTKSMLATVPWGWLWFHSNYKKNRVREIHFNPTLTVWYIKKYFLLLLYYYTSCTKSCNIFCLWHVINLRSLKSVNRYKLLHVTTSSIQNKNLKKHFPTCYSWIVRLSLLCKKKPFYIKIVKHDNWCWFSRDCQKYQV